MAKKSRKINQSARAQMLLDITAPRIVPQHTITIPINSFTTSKKFTYADKLVYGEIYTLFNLTSKVQLNKKALSKPLHIAIAKVTHTINKLKKYGLIKLFPVYDKNYHKKHGVIGYIMQNNGMNKTVTFFNNALQSSDFQQAKQLNHHSGMVNKVAKIVIGYFNKKVHKKYRWQTYTKDISGRLKEHYTLHDFIVVINHKFVDWYHDPKMNKFLRPKTLFIHANFDTYLNETPRAKHYSNVPQAKVNLVTQKVIGYLNQKITSNFRWQTYCPLVNALLSQHYTIEDFDTVIDNKYQDWHDESTMRQNLVPQVLFNQQRFDQYLNEKPKSDYNIGNGNGDYIPSRKSDFNGISI